MYIVYDSHFFVYNIQKNSGVRRQNLELNSVRLADSAASVGTSVVRVPLLPRGDALAFGEASYAQRLVESV